MIDPATIVNNLVDLLRDIPDLVDLVDGDEERIFAYHDRFAKTMSLETAKYQQPSPSIMVAWMGTGPGGMGGMEVWKHDISLFLRSGTEEDGEDPTGYYLMFRQITRGQPTSLSVPLIYATVHESCQPMDTPAIRRDTDMMQIDFMEVTMSFTEIGDS